MDIWIGLPALVVMLLGLAGTVLPVLPGLLVVWLAAVGSIVMGAWTGGAWITVTLLTLLFAGAIVAQYALPARAGRTSGAPRSSLAAGAAGGVVGFFVIPVIGFVVGGVAGIYLAERSRLHDPDTAWVTTRAVLRSAGVAALIEVGAGILMIVIWLVHVIF